MPDHPSKQLTLKTMMGMPTSERFGRYKHHQIKRATLGIAIAAVVGLCLQLGTTTGVRSNNDDGRELRSLAELMEEDLIFQSRILMETINEKEYAELAMPDWLRDLAEEDVTSTIASMAQSYTDPSRHTLDDLPPYTLEDLVDASLNYENTYALMVYDPPTDSFLFVYDVGRMEYGSSVTKLRMSYTGFAYMLRQLLPERFQGAESDELVLGIGSGDFPHLSYRCLKTFPHANEENGCKRSEVPVLTFGSVFRSGEIFPNVVAMPMPEVHHLGCFKYYTKMGKVCPTMQENLGYDKLLGLEYKDLIPQLVWRGTDFGYLTSQTSLNRPVPSYNAKTGEVAFEVTGRATHADVFEHPEWQGTKKWKWNIQYKFPVVLEGADTANAPNNPLEKKRLAAGALLAAFDKLYPRWKGVALTASAEVAAEDANRENDGEGEVLPWANMKFSKMDYEMSAKAPTKGKLKEKMEETIRLFDEYGVPYEGERMAPSELARYKYHIDIGGGGGTTWSGTTTKLAMPGLLFHHVTPTKDYIHDRMEPWVHYVPIAPDLSDLKEKFDWAEANPAAAEAIANQGTQLVRDLGTDEGFGALFENHFMEPLRRAIEAYQPVSSAHPGGTSSWKDVLREFQERADREHNFSDKWQCTGLGSSLYDQCHLTKGQAMAVIKR